ncbi:MAG: hypothetical protein RL700_550 [Pseudomonadota bacterium]
MKKGPAGPFVCERRSVFVATAAAITTTTATTAVAATTFTATATTTTVATTAAAAAAVTTAATAAVATAATTARWARLHGTGFVDDQAATTERLAIHAADGCLRFRIRRHLHKAEAFGATGVAFHHDLGACDGTKLTKRLFQIAITNGIRQIAHVQFVAHSGTP